ncbi:MAG: formate dehydrogenase accessory sulfurtransferase FdhD [Bordetella sp.]|nr:MAG: formate dehydrogenase accessory sulfurtransferase FdhD [Bordetella sp.]
MNKNKQTALYKSDCMNISIHRIHSGKLNNETECDWVAQETPIALEYNGINHVTMLASPNYLKDFAVGFSLTEGIIKNIHEIRNVEFQEQPQGIVIQLEISTASAVKLRKRRRFMLGNTGCGLCGIDALKEIITSPIETVSSCKVVSIAAILEAMKNMRKYQVLYKTTGATHAAGWANSEGQLCLVREDVGRHNALDKLIGGLINHGFQADTGMILISSRASFEMVQKTISSGCGILAAISAPTARAVSLAERASIGLLGFIRQDNASIYTHPERICF